MLQAMNTVAMTKAAADAVNPSAVVSEHLAAEVGAHALAWYGAAVAVLMAAAYLAMWSARRWSQRRPADSSRPAAEPRWPLLLPMAAGFAVIVGCAWVFSELAEGLGTQAAFGRADQILTDAIGHGVPHAALRVYGLVTHAADRHTQAGVCGVVAVLLLWRRHSGLALGWFAAIAGNGALNTSLKQVFARVRPEHDHVFAVAEGFSFPSGHSSGSVVVYGMLAYVVMRWLPARWHPAIAAIAVGTIFSIGISRVMLRVHFATDVMAGFASGTAWLVICIASLEVMRDRAARRNRHDRVANPS